ncbi:MAG: hypothetical protein M2R45_00857 [Verrucomicrobia subdivision 3 bacterium]|nr:hypothetical protein [Limisphaerales bacterium]MCS1414525.1 hypothetical protein [Limisphaerales bacterium]
MLAPPLRLGQTQVAAIAHLRRTLEHSKPCGAHAEVALRQSAGISKHRLGVGSLAGVLASAVTATAVFGSYLRFKPLGGIPFPGVLRR